MQGIFVFQVHQLLLAYLSISLGNAQFNVQMHTKAHQTKTLLYNQHGFIFAHSLTTFLS